MVGKRCDEMRLEKRKEERGGRWGRERGENHEMRREESMRKRRKDGGDGMRRREVKNKNARREGKRKRDTRPWVHYTLMGKEQQQENWG